MTNCEQCTLDAVIVPGYFPTNRQYEVLFVGQAPGRTEVITKQPFTGGAGKMLYSLCMGAGLTKRLIPQTSIVQCRPADKKDKDRAPTSLEVQCCHERLKREIWKVKPKLIVAFGTAAMEALTGKAPIATYRGSFHPLRAEFEYECEVLGCFHPSFVMRQRQNIPIATNDLKLVHKFFLEGVKKEQEPRYIYDPTPKELKAYLYSSTDGIVDFDTETTGLNKRTDYVIGASFSAHDDSACAMYFTGKDDPRIPVIKAFLEDPSVGKSTQNGSFDLEMVRSSFGIVVQNWAYDTKLAEQLINSDLPKNLDHLRAVYTNMRAYKPSKAEMKEISTWGKERMLLYAAKDAQCTRLVRIAQQKLLTPGYRHVLHELLIPASIVFNKMERRGMLLDIPRLAGMYGQLIPRVEELRQQIEEEAGINPASPKQLKAHFGIDSSDRQTLEDMVAKGHPQWELLKQILEFRDMSKGASTFLKGVYDRREGERIHTSYNPTGTGTGRTSSSNPNLQNIQKKYRVIYIADPGCVLIARDYNQLELNVTGVLAPGDNLRQALLNGLDVHGELLAVIESHIPERLMWNKRNVAKTVVFGTLYGRGARSIAIAFGVSIATAEKWQHALFDRFPDVYAYREQCVEEFKSLGYIDTPFGRRRYVQSVPQAINARIQSSANDIKLKALIGLDAAGLDCRLDVHDEIVICSPEDQVRENARLMKEVMEQPIEELGGVCFATSCKVGHNWYEMQDYEEAGR